MTTEHTNLLNKTLINGSKINGTRLWSNPCGMGYMGQVVSQKTIDGDRYVTLKNPRIVKYGLCPGSLDIVGFHSFKGMPIYTEIDIKVGRDTVKKIQQQRIDMIRSNGGFAGIVKKEDDIYKIFK